MLGFKYYKKVRDKSKEMVIKTSLRTRIFLNVFLVIASVLIAGVTVNQYHSQTKDYAQRLFRKK